MSDRPSPWQRAWESKSLLPQLQCCPIFLDLELGTNVVQRRQGRISLAPQDGSSKHLVELVYLLAASHFTLKSVLLCMTNSVVTIKLTLVSCGFEVPRPGKPSVLDKPGHLVAIETAVSKLTCVLDVGAAPPSLLVCSPGRLWCLFYPALLASKLLTGWLSRRQDQRRWPPIPGACGLPGRVPTLCQRPAGPVQGRTVLLFPYLRAVGIYPSYESQL